MTSYYRWRDAQEEKPIDFALVEVVDDYGIKQCAWWDSKDWDFGVKRLKGPVVSWKYEKMYYY